MQKRLTVFFSGTVQGVGFRYTVEKLSRQFQVSGHVKNLKDGRVEVAAEGEEKELGQFLQAIRQSGMAHYIADAEASWDEPSGEYKNFEITYA